MLQQIIKTKKYYIYLVVAFILFYLNFCNNKEFSDLHKVPFTKKEKFFIENLRKEGYNKVEFIRPMIGDWSYGSSHQILYLSINKNIKGLNFDSLLEINKFLAQKMYYFILEDSVIYDSYSVFIDIKYYYDSLNLNAYRSFYKEYQIDSLEKWCGFKVEKVGKDKYRRIDLISGGRDSNLKL